MGVAILLIVLLVKFGKRAPTQALASQPAFAPWIPVRS
jgi:hypothetical protein